MAWGEVEKVLPGAYHFHNARTMHIDSLVRSAISDGVRQIVLLGAGYDSRAYRLGAVEQGIRFFEVDLPALQHEKKARVAKLLGGLPPHVTYIPVDFNHQRLEDLLLNEEYTPSEPSFFNWEGVSYYLSARGVDATLAFVAERSAPGSQLAMDYMPVSMVNGTNDYYGAPESRDYMARLGEPFTFGIEDGAIECFLSQRGFRVLSDIGPPQLEGRYSVRTDGQLHGRVLGFIRIVHAEVEGRRAS